MALDLGQPHPPDPKDKGMLWTRWVWLHTVDPGYGAVPVGYSCRSKGFPPGSPGLPSSPLTFFGLEALKLHTGPSPTMKLLLLTLAALLLLSQLTPGNVDLLREGARQGDPGLVSESPGAWSHHSQPHGGGGLPGAGS